MTLLDRRAAGILLPISSLFSPYGIGAFGKAAYRFIDFLHSAKQRYWQVLPMGSISFGNSPYQSPSAFAGNPYYIDLTLLIEAHYLTAEECDRFAFFEDAGIVDYNALQENREALLRIAFSRFCDHSALRAFSAEHAYWIFDYALFMTLRKQHHEISFLEWPAHLRFMDVFERERMREAYQEDIDYYIFIQYLFFTQWKSLKAYANEKGVSIIGDIPIYVSLDSADVWANSALFLLDSGKKPSHVAGVPPDYFSHTGQLWGNPLYDWGALKETNYQWWIARLKLCFSLYDVVRIDHFRALDSFYAIPYGEKTAQNGIWMQGPGMDFIRAVKSHLGDVSIIAEDLGYLTQSVLELLKNSAYPGMKVLQFAFDSDENNAYRPHNCEPNSVVYTGTHDNSTLAGLLNARSRESLRYAFEYFGVSDKFSLHCAMLRHALMCPAHTAIIPMQDYLMLGDHARINIPSTIGGKNWRWRLCEDMLSTGLEKRIARMCELYGR